MSRFLLVLPVVLVSTLARAGDFKAAYVDIQRAVQEVDEGRAAKARLQTLATDRQKVFEKEQTALRTEVEAFQKQVSTMADDVRRKREDELQKKGMDFQQRTEKLRAELADNERKELSTIFPRLEKLLGDLAQREGFTMIFDKSSSGLAWAPTSLDLTNDLIRSYNNAYPAPRAKESVKKETPVAPGTGTAKAPTEEPKKK